MSESLIDGLSISLIASPGARRAGGAEGDQSMRFSCVQRRHDRSRLQAKRLRESARYAIPDYRTSEEGEREWLQRMAALRVHTACQCSCFMCSNVRRYAGNSAAGKTRQELIAEYRQSDEE